MISLEMWVYVVWGSRYRVRSLSVLPGKRRHELLPNGIAPHGNIHTRELFFFFLFLWVINLLLFSLYFLLRSIFFYLLIEFTKIPLYL